VDPDHEPVAWTPVEVDHDGVRRVGGERLQVRRALRRDDVDFVGERAEALDRVSGVRRPRDQDDAQA
jgi:hypothetical protein